MPSWISKRGVWHPAKEKAALKNHKTGEPFIYDGPDRAALYELFLVKQETLGTDFFNDSDLLTRVKQLGYKDIKEYAKAVGYDEEKTEKDFQEKASVVKLHELPEKVKAIDTLGGGLDSSGQGKDIYGDFGNPPGL